MPWLATLLLASLQEPGFAVENTATSARRELVRASLPLPRGRFRELPCVTIAGEFAPTEPLLRWPDGSIAVVQVQARLELGAGQRLRCAVDLAPAAPAPPQEAAPFLLDGDLPIQAELEDPWGAVYRSSLRGGTLVRQTSRVRVRRFEAVHVADRRRYLGVVAWLTSFAGERRAELILLLDNRAHGTASPLLGPVRLRRFSLVVPGSDLRIRPRWIGENHLAQPVPEGGGWRQPLLGPSDQLYLGDATAKAWSFDLFRDGPAVTAAEREAAATAADHPLRAVPDLAWTRHCGAFGAHGGPAPGPGEPTDAALWSAVAWRARADFGAFGGFGDPRDAAADGTPRNGPCALHNVVRLGSAELLGNAEAMVLQQTLRPTPGQSIHLPEAAAPLRQGLSPRTMQRPHGFTPLDYEHFTVDLLFDHYWLTGNPLAQAELARAGAGLRAVLRDLPFHTCRGEGWCMQAAVLIARATGDDALVLLVHERFLRTIEPALCADGAPCVLRQPPHPEALGGATDFDCPWQMAAFVHGAHAMLQQTGDRRYAAAAVRAGRAMAGPGWVEGRGPKYLVSAADEDRYMLPVGYGPLEGTAVMQVGAFVLAAEMATEERDKELFRRRAATILAPHERAEPGRIAANPWFQLVLDRRSR